ncbi:MAG: alpha-L-glutamate ligase [Nitrospira bacterium SG8_3]|nr:MAG: alpha-L-glutamate ligase [Nitrospira bacterium SG8_3]
MFELARKLGEIGVLGLNRRNADYTLHYNQRRLYPLVDDKLRTKQLAEEAGMAVPELYGVVEAGHQLRHWSDLLKGHSDFVVKPARGSGGEGILVISSRLKDMYRVTNGELASQSELNYHVLNILSGIYSLGGLPDKALVEYRVRCDPVFDAVTYQGVPDIRIVVFLGVPVMAMVRLPTRMSRGKANLHQGAIGSGIDMATGKTLTGVWGNDIVTEHPDTGMKLTDLKVPKWERLLHLASRCYELTGLGYQGVDLVLDRDRGPLILELNARPGLNIQIANHAGLLPRLKVVEQLRERLHSAEDCVAFSQERFPAWRQ